MSDAWFQTWIHKACDLTMNGKLFPIRRSKSLEGVPSLSNDIPKLASEIYAAYGSVNSLEGKGQSHLLPVAPLRP